MSWVDAVRLGRLSNLPTVWTNALAALVLAGSGFHAAATLVAMLGLSLAYVGGMYLNDAFDAEIDARQRPQRPIPSGRVPLRGVLIAGACMIAASIIFAGIAGALSPDAGWFAPTVAAVLLAGAILFYDWHHKANPLSPVVMGLCRALVYVVAALAVAGRLPGEVVVGALLLLGYIVGLTYLAKQEDLAHPGNWWPLAFLAAPILYGAWRAAAEPLTWLFLAAFAGVVAIAVAFVIRRAPGDIGRGVVLLLAGICLFDSVLIAGAGAGSIALLAAAGFPLTLLLQRVVPGT